MLRFFWATALSIFALSITSINSFGQVDDFDGVNFNRADSVAQLYPYQSLDDIPGLTEKLTRPFLSDMEKFRAIYSWVCLNIENDYALFQTNKSERAKRKTPDEIAAWNKKFKVVVFETLLKRKRTVCTGYAYLVRELALHAGLHCTMIDGYGRTPQANIGEPGSINHSWNAVQLNGKWYLCDATWSSGAIDTKMKAFIKKYDESYFLLDPSLFILSHYPLDTAEMLLDKKPTIHEFLNRPLVYGSALEFKLNQFYPETFNISVEKGKPVEFGFRKNGGKNIENVKIEIHAPNSTYVASPPFRQEGSDFSFDYVFNRKGLHIIQILLNDSYAYSHTVDVK